MPDGLLSPPPEGYPAVVSVLLGNGDGTFQTAVPYDTGAYGASAVAVADLNGDGKLDLAVANVSSTGSLGFGVSGALSVLLGNGDGTFQTAEVSVTPQSIAAVGLADLRSVGKLDLVATTTPTFADSVVYVLLGNGDGTFQSPVAYYTVSQCFSHFCRSRRCQRRWDTRYRRSK